MLHDTKITKYYNYFTLFNQLLLVQETLIYSELSPNICFKKIETVFGYPVKNYWSTDSTYLHQAE